MAFCYILYSSKLDKYYIGATDGTLDTRLKKHQNKHHGFTNLSNDWELVWSELFENKQDAFKKEKLIKSWKSRKLIVALINLSDAGSEHPD